MKIALCISGQPRQIFQSQYFDGSLPKDLEIDVYAHLWWNPQELDKPYKFHCLDTLNPHALEGFFKIYKPKRSIIEEQIQFDISSYDLVNGEQSRDLGENHRDLFSREVIFKQLSMYYSIQQAYRLVKGKYDWVVRGRTDLGFKGERIDWANLDPNALNTDRPHIDFPADGVNDSFWITSQPIAERLAHIYDYIPALSERKVIRSHTLLQRALNSLTIPVKELDWKVEIIRNFKQPKHMDTYGANTPAEELPFWFKN